MMTQEIKVALFEKLHELNSSPVSRADIAITKTAEETGEKQIDEIRQVYISRKWETTTLVSEALQRIESNTYGACANCDGPISPKRLAAIPWAKYCIACQEIRDSATSEVRWDDAA